MIIQDGWASSTDNPVVGPPVYTMVRFGAKETGLIVLRKQWWRIISPTMLHAGILHIAPNVLIQVHSTPNPPLLCPDRLILYGL